MGENSGGNPSDTGQQAQPPAPKKNEEIAEKKRQLQMYTNRDRGPYIVLLEPSEDNSIQIRPMSIGNKLIMSKVSKVTRVDSRGRNRVAVTFQTGEAANIFIRSNFIQKEKLKCFIPAHLISCKAIIRDVDRDWTEQDIMENLISDDGRAILRVERINRRSTDAQGTVEYVPTNTILVTFRGKIIPARVHIFYNYKTPEIYTPKVIQCFGCLRYGHTKKICKSINIRCPACAEAHELKDCPIKDAPTCLHCKGPHYTNEIGTRLNSRICPEYARQRKIKEAMVKYNYSFYEASNLFKEKNLPPINSNRDFPALNRQESIQSEIFPRTSNRTTYADTATRIRSPSPLAEQSASSARSLMWDHSYATTYKQPKRKRSTINSPSPPKNKIRNKQQKAKESRPLAYSQHSTEEEKEEEFLVSLLRQLAETLCSKTTNISNSRLAPAIKIISEILNNLQKTHNKNESLESESSEMER